MKRIILLTLTALLLSPLAASSSPAGDTLAASNAVDQKPAKKITIAEAVAGTCILLQGRHISDILGVTHTRGQYAFTDNPFLIEGAEAVNTLGAQIIKLWFSPGYQKSYAWHSQWPTNISSLEELAQTSYFEAVFAMPFHTYVLEVYEFMPKNDFWRNGLSPADRERVHDDVYKLARLLLTRYRGTGKTFVLQNWESDNAIKHALKGARPDTWDVAYQGMRDWINTRQAAVEQARRECGTNGVQVVNALEVNFVPPWNNLVSGKPYKKTYPLVVDIVVPQTHCDLYSLSSWETWSPGSEESVFDRLQYLAAKAPHNGIFGTNNLMLGEFGAHEDVFEKPEKNYPIYRGDTAGAAFYALQLMVNSALRAGVRYMIHWQIYDNDLRMGGKEEGKGLPPGVMATAEQCVGNWLIRPDGAHVPTYDYFKGLFDAENTNSTAHH